MAIKVAINGFGRIGRNILRAIYEHDYRHEVKVVAINDLGDAAVNAHLLEFDSVHGHFPHSVSYEGGRLFVNGDFIHVLSEQNPADLPWESLDIDVVLECTGLFTARGKAELHLFAGAKKVLVSAPGTNMDATVVFGVNHDILTENDRIVSNASCTTNCLAPLAQVLHEAIGIDKGVMTTIHSYTNDQSLTDVFHKDLRRARSATSSQIPTKTGAASAVGLVLPELAGRLDGLAVRVPTSNVSLVDFTFNANRETTVDEVNKVMESASLADKYGILKINKKPLVSIDFNHNRASCIFDTTQTRVDGSLVKVLAWYDNEWGFSNRMIDNVQAMMSVGLPSGKSETNFL